MEWWQILLIVLGCLLLLFVLSIVLYKQFFKRFWDVVLSGLAIIVLSPIFLLLMAVGAIAMGGNPFFVQERPGKKDKGGKERIFKLIKFRTMSNKRDSNGVLLPDGQRLNKYGAFLRSTSLDELPELLNIFIGNMSLVGPRPLLVEYLPWYTIAERRRHDIRPGLTGWAQINGRNAVSWDSRFILDIYYVNHFSLFFDIKVLLRTVLQVVKRKGVLVNTDSLEGNMAEIRRKKKWSGKNA